MSKKLINRKELQTAIEYIQMFGPGIKDFLLNEAKLNLHPAVIDDLIKQAEEQYNEMVKVEKIDDEIIDEDGIWAVLVTIENKKPVKKYIKIKNYIERLKKFLKTNEIEIKELGFTPGESKFVAVVDKTIQNKEGVHWFAIEHNYCVGNVLVFKKGLKEVDKDINKIKIEYEGLSENLDEIFLDI